MYRCQCPRMWKNYRVNFEHVQNTSMDFEEGIYENVKQKKHSFLNNHIN